MNVKEIKLVVSHNEGLEIYRKGECWRRMDESDDALRPYIHSEMDKTTWDENFFDALQAAVFEKEDNRLLIWFEGPADTYNDFCTSLNNCNYGKNIWVKKLQTEQPGQAAEGPCAVEELKAEIEKEDTSCERRNKNMFTAENAGAAATQVVDEEQIDETTGILEYPGAGAWSWRKKYPEVPAEEKETLRIDKNIIIDREMTLINKTIVLAANVGLTVKVECIHCTICIEQNAGVDILKNAALWLKHCVIQGRAPEKQWLPSGVRNALAVVNGALHIYDSVVHHLEIGEANKERAAYGINEITYAIKNYGTCHIVDTKIQYFTGRYIDTRSDNFCGSRISTDHFSGMLINACLRDSTRLEYCTFHFSCKKDPFIWFGGDIYSSEFVRTDNKPFEKYCMIIVGYIQKSTFDTVGYICAYNAVFEECKFTRYFWFNRSGPLEFKKCSFVNDITFGKSLIHCDESIIVAECKFYRCICDKIFEFSSHSKLMMDKNYVIENNTFLECVASDVLFYAEINHTMTRSKKLFSVSKNKFYSCGCTAYVKSKATYGVFRKPYEVFKLTENEEIQALSPWTEAMQAARCEEDVVKLEKALKE